jgi:DUF4097 and DUF4098 domain-containing protein YvlB
MTRILVALSLGITFSCQQPKTFGQINTEASVNIDREDAEDEEDNEDGKRNCTYKNAFKIKDNETIHNEYALSADSKVKVYNLSGSITVVSHDGDKAIVDIVKTIFAKSPEAMDKAKSLFKLGADSDQGLVLYTAAPYDTRPKIRGENFNYNSDDNQYWVNLDYTIKLPRSASVHASTVNDGDILINNIDGEISVNNVNGDISLDNIKKTKDVATVNGDIKVSYKNFETINGTYTTINGDITLAAPGNLSAEVECKSMNGEIYTDYDDFKPLSKVQKLSESSNGSTIIRMDKIEGIILGTGTSKLKFETLNGDIFIKKQN